MYTYSHGSASLDQIHHGIRQSQSTSGFDGPRDKLDLGRGTHFVINRFKIGRGNIGKRGHNALSRQVLDTFDLLHDGCLHTEFALAKTQIHDSIDDNIRFLHDINTGNANIDIAFTDVLGNVGGG
jgi:hypothetical protein